jgi:Tol biopolymer transport system component
MLGALAPVVRRQTRLLPNEREESTMTTRKLLAWTGMILFAAAALLVSVASAGAAADATEIGVVTPPVGPCDPTSCVPTIAFTSTRDYPSAATPAELFSAGEIYLMNPDGTSPRRLTENMDGDAFAALSPDGKKVAFDSNRNRLEGEPLNTSDLFVMNTDGSEQTFLTRGSSATWSPDSKSIAFHASASGSGTPIRTDPGSATSDSDIFVANIDDLVAGVELPTNITNSAHVIDDDPDWSPDGRRIVYTAHADSDDPRLSNTAEIHVLNADGSGTPERLTCTYAGDHRCNEEERAPDWSPDGTRIEFMCRIGGGSADFELCVMDADGSNVVQLTDNTVPDLSANWSPDGEQLVFHRPVAGLFQLFVINSTLNEDGTLPTATKLTSPPGLNGFPDWGLLRVNGSNSSP